MFLWCLVRGKKCKAAAPTGIAAANVEIDGTDVSATTIHAMFDLDTEFQTKLDLSKFDHAKVATLMALEVLLLDEVSMIDVDCFACLASILSNIDHSKRPNAQGADDFGNVHVLLFGDFKQLPPATSKAPFIVFPKVESDFTFRVLRQNRRVVTDASRANELENFHEVLSDISWGRATPRVRDFIVKAYVRGATCGNAERSELEGSTSVFTKRRFRDGWNRVIVRRLAKTKNHSLKVKARVRARGARGQHWYNERRTQLARKKSRTQALWNLHLAGDWHPDSETKSQPSRPHMMRTMLVSNLAGDNSVFLFQTGWGRCSLHVLKKRNSHQWTNGSLTVPKGVCYIGALRQCCRKKRCLHLIQICWPDLQGSRRCKKKRCIQILTTWMSLRVKKHLRTL